MIFFICPYGTAISTVRWAVRRLGRDGFHVVAYETTLGVFLDGDREILPGLIAAVRADITAQIARLTSEGVTEFGFVGSSLGSFIFYNCVGDAVPELRWGVFNTGGDIARGMWRLEGARQAYVRRGWSLDRLEAAWAGVQWPEFGRQAQQRPGVPAGGADPRRRLGDLPHEDALGVIHQVLAHPRQVRADADARRGEHADRPDARQLQQSR